MATALTCGDKVLDLSSPKIMGILNLTPDSFSDGGLFVSDASKNSGEVYVEKAVAHAASMVKAGASIIDLGGESTRPGAEEVGVSEEAERVFPVLQLIKNNLPDCLVSVDTSKPEIMEQAVLKGANIINDVNALQAPGAIDVIANSKAAVCLMHMQGKPRTMQNNPQYANVIEDVRQFLEQRINACLEAGISLDRIIIDPGFGFGKTLEHNLQLLKHLQKFKLLGAAVLVGVSRKSMIGSILDKPVDQRIAGSLGLAALSAWLGADIIRVHDVEQSVDAVNVVHAVRSVEA